MSNQPTKTLIPILIIAGLFFIFGFITWINGSLIPFMKTINELTSGQSYLVASASYISFVIMAIPASLVIEKMGYKNSMSLGLIVMGLGALVFIPAANARAYWIFLLGIFIQGAGMTLLQTAANPYITILGPIESAAKRISIMGIANKVAGALGAFIFGSLLLSGIKEINEKLTNVGEDEKAQLLSTMADSVIMPYIIMAIILFVLGIAIRYAPLPHVEPSPMEEVAANESTKNSILQFPHLWLGVLTLFVYVGAEVIAVDTISSYGLSLGFDGDTIKAFPTYTLMAMVATYALGIVLIPKYISQATALKASALLGMILTIAIVYTTGFTSILLVALLGVANALVWPAVWPLTLEGLGKFTKTASALLIMAIAGGAIIPPLYGWFVDENRLKLIGEGLSEAGASAQAATGGYWILLPLYAIILYYAIAGHKLGLKKG